MYRFFPSSVVLVELAGLSQFGVKEDSSLLPLFCLVQKFRKPSILARKYSSRGEWPPAIVSSHARSSCHQRKHRYQLLVSVYLTGRRPRSLYLPPSAHSLSICTRSPWNSSKSSSMQIHRHSIAVAFAIASALSANVADATPVNIINQCGESIELWDNSVLQVMAPGQVITRVISNGFHGMFRAGVNPQATRTCCYKDASMYVDPCVDEWLTCFLSSLCVSLQSLSSQSTAASSGTTSVSSPRDPSQA